MQLQTLGHQAPQQGPLAKLGTGHYAEVAIFKGGRGRPGRLEFGESQNQGCEALRDLAQEHPTCEIGESVTFAPWALPVTGTSSGKGKLCIEALVSPPPSLSG